MSSGLPETAAVPSGHGSTRRRRPTSLARRIGAGVLLILMATILAYSFYAAGITKALLTESASRDASEAWIRASEQLTAPSPGGGGDGGPGQGDLRVPGTLGQPEGTVVALVPLSGLEEHRQDALTGHRVGDAGQSVPLTAREAHDLLHALRDRPGGPMLDAVVGDVSYRVQAQTLTAPGPWVAADQVLVVGAPTGAMSDVARQALLAVAVGLSVTVLTTAILVTLWLRRGLAPLREVAAVAERVAQVDMARAGLDPEDSRMPPRLLQGPDEVAVVAQALDRFTGSVEAALEQRRVQEQQMRRFMADASHELRTPLASVRGYAEMIAMTEELSATGRRSLDRVLFQADRMAALVDDMLLLERLESVSRGRAMGLKPSGEVALAEQVDLSEVVLEGVMDARAAWPDHTWVVDLPAGVEPGTQRCVTGDRSQLARVVGNLLSNAAKHTPVGTTVTASVREDRPRPGLMLVSVHDDGGGIPADRHATLFHRFVRGPGKGRTSASGTEPSTGLGLAIVRSIARSHGGDVTVASEGGWTRFDVVVPCTPGRAGPGAAGSCCGSARAGRP